MAAGQASQRLAVVGVLPSPGRLETAPHRLELALHLALAGLLDLKEPIMHQQPRCWGLLASFERQWLLLSRLVMLLLLVVVVPALLVPGWHG